MDVELLSRIQFSLTIMFHYIFPPLSIGLGLHMVIMEGLFLKTKQPVYQQMAKYWTRIFAVTFAIGVATGIVMEFEFGTNWATYSRFVGDVFGSALAAEGIFAFFLESGFLAILLFGWNKVSPKIHFFATCMVCLGAHFSAVWIVVANSWMQTPAGFHIVGDGGFARAEITDFWAMVFNPSSVVRLSHTLVGAWLAGGFFVISVSCFYLLKKKFIEFSEKSLRIALTICLFSIILQAVLGHFSGQIVAKYQPMKLASLEGIYQTTKGASLHLFGLPDSASKEVKYSIAIPKLLSFVAHDDFNAEIKGLETIPREDWPNVPAVFISYRLMLGSWLAMLFSLCVLLFKRTTWSLRLGAFSVLFPQIGNQAGWVAAEMGRYPWMVQGLLRISEGLSKTIGSREVLSSLIMFSVVYLFLFFMFIYLLNEKITEGPKDEDLSSHYHGLEHLMEEVKHD